MNLICTLLTLSFESWTYSAMQDGRVFIGEKPTSFPQDTQNTSGKMCKSAFPQLNSLKPTWYSKNLILSVPIQTL